MDVEWSSTGYNSYEAKDRNSGEVIRTASRTDLVFGSNSELRAIAEVYAQDDNNAKFISDFIQVWNKIMDADRFDLRLKKRFQLFDKTRFLSGFVFLMNGTSVNLLTHPNKRNHIPIKAKS
jgi:catalase-peroxidase